LGLNTTDGFEGWLESERREMKALYVIQQKAIGGGEKRGEHELKRK
jgi:hypothetical protein